MKKLTVGACVSALAAILTVVSLIVYAVNINGTGYFNNASVSNLVLYCVLAIAALAVAVALAYVKAPDSANMVLDLVAGALQIVAPALLALCLINLIAARAEGLGFIYFSNADVLLEVQTPANLSSAACAIANMVLLAVSTVVGIVAAFFNTKKAA